MGKVAVAGGSSGLGRTIVDALEAAKTHDYIVLSRKATGSEARAVDYFDKDSLASLLEYEQVDTIISCLPIDNDDSGQAQLNLIEAAERSKCTRRFLPSEFGMIYTEDNLAVPSYHWKLKAVDILGKTGLEFSLISIGLFLDYWATPRIPSHIHEANILIDPENNAAVIPGDGNAHIPLTHSTDAAKFTIALLDLPQWKQRYTIVPNRITLNEAVRLIEEIKGVKLDVQYFSVEALQRGEIDLTPRMKKILPQEAHEVTKSMVASSGLRMAKGENDFSASIDDLTVQFPNIKTLTVREVWEAWK